MSNKYAYRIKLESPSNTGRTEYPLPVAYGAADASRALSDFQGDRVLGQCGPSLQRSHVYGVWHDMPAQ
jgi:hypothetical protein